MDFFWKWINKNEEEYSRERFGFGKRILVGFIIFFLIPIFLYHLIMANPIYGFDEDCEPMKAGPLIVLFIYWIGAYFSHKAYKTRKRLNSLIDKLLNKENRNQIIEIVKTKEEALKEDIFISEKGEERIKWFNIK